MKVLSVCALVVAASALGNTQTPQTAAQADSSPLAIARVFPYEQMPVRTSTNGAEMRSVFNGTLATGEAVGVHESTQPAGNTPGPLHVIHHSEVIVVIEGTVEFDHDGKAERAGPGGIIYVALGTEHRIKNVGDGLAKYAVIQIGGDTRK